MCLIDSRLLVFFSVVLFLSAAIFADGSVAMPH